MNGPSGPSGVLVIDDQPVFADSLASALTNLGVPATACGPPGESAVELARSLQPAVVLLDLSLGDEDGVDLVAALKRSGARVVAVSGTEDRSHFGAALSAGADGYVPKGAPFAELVATVRKATAGAQLISGAERAELVALLEHSQRERAEARRILATLTPAERRVLDLLAAGWTAREVANNLFVSMSTVRAQIRSIHTKLDVTHQLAAVAVLHAAGP